MTKGEIDRLGDRIRTSNKEIDDLTLENLQEYRVSHKETLSQIFNSLCSLAHRVNKVSIITYRLKRFESIISKLNRYPDMKFSRMWDVAGCRCIFSNNDHVYRFKKLIEEHSTLIIKKEYDYINDPQETGYKSLHLFLTIPNSPVTIEVQIRNQIDHNWATLVEITDLLFDAQLKEYSKDKKLLEFHFLLSKRDNLELNERRIIADAIRSYKYFKKLSEVFTKNYLQVRKRWVEIESQGGQYYLIETRKDEVPKIFAFKNAIDAENGYFNTYKSTRNANIVLTHLPVPNYNHISTAYSNYLLTFHSFLIDCFDILGSLLEESLKNRKYLAFIKYFLLYNEITLDHNRNLLSEIDQIERLNENKGTSKRSKLRKSEKEWIRDLNRQVDLVNNKHRRIRKLLEDNSGQFVFSMISNYIRRRYTKRLRALLENNNKPIFRNERI
jgi:putative GTP pyrophosphokinase